MYWVALISTLFYVGLMIYWRAYLYRLKHCEKNQKSEAKFSVIIAYRNEEQNLVPLCQSLSRLALPHDYWEVIFVDDHSTDNSAAELDAFLSCIPMKKITSDEHGKKAALRHGIQAAQFENLFFTDADCVLPEELLSTLQEYSLPDRVVLGPVKLSASDRSFLQYFQQVDFAMMQMATACSTAAGHIFLANGANLSYSKKLYTTSDKLDDSRSPSGDDILMVQSVSAHAETVYCYERDAIVTTPAETSLRDFINQRIRWASKTSLYTGNFAQLVSLTFAWINLMLWGLLFVGIFKTQYLQVLLICMLMKFCGEMVLLLPGLRFFGIPIRPLAILLAQPLHIAYMTYVGIRSRWGQYEWKGRRY